MLPSAILREDDPARSDATWHIYFTIIMNHFKEFFINFALKAPPDKKEKEKWNENLRNLREKLSGGAQAIMAKQINLDNPLSSCNYYCNG